MDLEQSDDDRESIEAPPFSPISDASHVENESDGESIEMEEYTTETLECPEEVMAEQPSTHTECTDYNGTQHGTHDRAGNGTEEGWPGFKIVGDNVDKNIHRAYQRLDMQTQSLHYFHCYAVRDRVNLSAYSDSPRHNPDVDPVTLLPLLSDMATVQHDCEILVAR